MKKQMTEKTNTNKGITLIALVITIIVMLILVAVTISMAVNGGLFEYAGRAGQETNGAIANEQELANLEADMTVDELIDKYTNSQGGTGNGGTDTGVIPVPDEEDIFKSFDVGVEEGTVTAYLVENAEATASAGEPVYDMLIIGNGEMSNLDDWNCEEVVSYSNFSYGVEGLWHAKIDNIVISEGVTSIGDYAFSNCSSLKNVIIPNSITSINNRAFDDCIGLTSVIIPNSVTSIGDSAFRGCIGLTSLIIPGSVASIGDYAFCGCTGLTSVTIPGSVSSVGNSAFYECEGLTSLIIQNGIKQIGFYAFSGCDGLTSVTFPDSLTWIGSYAFTACDRLASITLPVEFPWNPEAFGSNLTTIYYRGTEEQWGDKEFAGTIIYNYNG